MAARTYLWGYAGQRRTRATIDGYWQVAAMHPEFRRRMWALINAALNAGHDLGIGGGTRTEAQQRALWIARGGIGVARAGFSYHEEEATPLGAIAVDLVGDLDWNIANCKRFGLDHLAALDEKWHDQLLELPRSRAEYKQNPSAFPIRIWDLPGSGAVPDPPIVVPPTPVHPPPVLTPGAEGEEDMFSIAGKTLNPDGSIGAFRIGNGRTSIVIGGDLVGQHEAVNARFGGMVDAKTASLQMRWGGVNALPVADLDRICGKVRA